KSAVPHTHRGNRHAHTHTLVVALTSMFANTSEGERVNTHTHTQRGDEHPTGWCVCDSSSPVGWDPTAAVLSPSTGSRHSHHHHPMTTHQAASGHSGPSRERKPSTKPSIAKDIDPKSGKHNLFLTNGNRKYSPLS